MNGLVKSTCVATAMVAGTFLLSPATAIAKYEKVDNDSISSRSTDGVARSFGSVNWYVDRGFFRDVRRGDYAARSKVRALRPVGCIWAKVSYTHITGGFDVSPGGPGGSLGTGTYTQDGYYTSCRAPGAKRPKALSLYGVGYPKTGLLSTTLSIGTSRRKSDGPRNLSNKKVWYPVGADG